MASIAEVTLWGQRVGALAHASSDDTATFEYAAGWLNEHIEIAPLTLPWRLAPAFDIAYSYKPDSAWVNAHQMSLNGKRDHFERADLLAVADQLRGFREQAMRIIEEVTHAVSEWRLYARDAGVDPDFSATIQRHLRLELAR